MLDLWLNRPVQELNFSLFWVIFGSNRVNSESEFQIVSKFWLFTPFQ